MKNQRYRIKQDPGNIYINGCLVKYGFEVRNEQRLAKQLGFESNDDEDLGDFETSESATELIDWEI